MQDVLKLLLCHFHGMEISFVKELDFKGKELVFDSNSGHAVTGRIEIHRASSR